MGDFRPLSTDFSTIFEKFRSILPFPWAQPFFWPDVCSALIRCVRITSSISANKRPSSKRITCSPLVLVYPAFMMVDKTVQWNPLSPREPTTIFCPLAASLAAVSYSGCRCLIICYRKSACIQCTNTGWNQALL